LDTLKEEFFCLAHLFPMPFSAGAAATLFAPMQVRFPHLQPDLDVDGFEIAPQHMQSDLYDQVAPFFPFSPAAVTEDNLFLHLAQSHPCLSEYNVRLVIVPDARRYTSTSDRVIFMVQGQHVSGALVTFQFRTWGYMLHHLIGVFFAMEMPVYHL